MGIMRRSERAVSLFGRSSSERRRKRERKRERKRKGAYFLCRCRLSSLRCLCLRIFLRRFLITLPNGSSPHPELHTADESPAVWSGPRCRESPCWCQGERARCVWRAHRPMRIPSGSYAASRPKRFDLIKLRAPPSARLIGCLRGRKGSIGTPRRPRLAISSWIRVWPGSIIRPRRR